MNIRFLETFLWAARLRSFKAAAGKLNLTQAAISGRIAALESDLGEQLFERGSRDTRLTAAGRTLLDYAQHMLETDQSMRQALKGPPVLRGVVRLGVVESIVHTWFTPFISRLYEAHPELDVEMTAASTRRLQDLLKQGNVDAALQTDPVVAEDVRNRDLGTLRMGWICSPRLGVSKQAPAAELARHQLITFPRHSQPHLQLLDVLAHAGVRPGRIHFVSSIAASTQFIEAGLGIAALPVAAVQAGIDSGKYVCVQSPDTLPDMRLVASWRPDPVSGLAEAVVRLALDEARGYAAQCADAGPPLDSGVLAL
ncbi:LysR family transcriptional regulator [Bordetella ansorpii]|uniref:LysR family transcriptional regulator n=1 Tax=Bordetella ansorpii TaxID=288768 RepID=A0A157SWB7_9BORD|nr:LysR family transcriptional regulator [Bordetella ansorpii]SAI74750.1 LysR family transcriptional regulator [Bordetella ansorpii]